MNNDENILALFMYIAPSAPPMNISVYSSSITSTAFVISWDPPALIHQNGIVTYYTVILLEEETGVEYEHTSFSTSLSVHSMHPAYTYQCRVAAHTVAQGPFSQPINVTTNEDCKLELSVADIASF